MLPHKLSTALDAADVERLLRDPSALTRAETAAKVARHFDGDRLSPRERQLAEDIIRMMTRDAEVLVRRVLSTALKDCPDLPHDVAVTIAKDVAEVAVPMLESSPVLNDADLLEIIREKPADHQKAVARRRDVSAVLSDALVDTGESEVVAELVANDSAKIVERTIGRVLDDFGADGNISAAVANRPRLPVRIVERLVSRVADEVRDRLVAEHELPAGIANELVQQSRERVTLGYLHQRRNPSETESLVRQLRGEDRLTPTIILRALCLGDIDFFEFSLATIAAIPRRNVRTLLLDASGRGVTALHRRCGLPEKWLRVVLIAIEVALEVDLLAGNDSRELYRDRLTEEVLDRIEDKFDGNIMAFLVARPVEEFAGGEA